MRRLPLRSPPRMRGKAKNRCRSCPLTRITPACAGKRDIPPPGRTAPGDHPRVCGEKSGIQLGAVGSKGSPPRVRGKVISSLQCDFLSGITPACAGKRKRSRLQRSGTGDHPRVCGEKQGQKDSIINQLGSPPRMRGKVLGSLAAAHDAGITPAYAGKRTRSSRMQHAHRDHPRVCGEKHG